MRKQLLSVVAIAAVAVPALAWSGRGDSEEFKAARAATFAEADTNRDGALSPTEFATFKQLMHEKRAQRGFQRADADGNGAVTVAELEAGKKGKGCH